MDYVSNTQDEVKKKLSKSVSIQQLFWVINSLVPVITAYLWLK